MKRLFLSILCLFVAHAQASHLFSDAQKEKFNSAFNYANSAIRRAAWVYGPTAVSTVAAIASFEVARRQKGTWRKFGVGLGGNGIGFLAANTLKNYLSDQEKKAGVKMSYSVHDASNIHAYTSLVGGVLSAAYSVHQIDQKMRSLERTHTNVAAQLKERSEACTEYAIWYTKDKETIKQLQSEIDNFKKDIECKIPVGTHSIRDADFNAIPAEGSTYTVRCSNCNTETSYTNLRKRGEIHIL